MLVASLPTDHVLYIGINSTTPCTPGKIKFPFLSNMSDIDFQLSPGEGKMITLGGGYETIHWNEIDPNGEILNSTVLITANEEVIVYALSGCSLDDSKQVVALRVLDVSSLGTNYWITTQLKLNPSLLL